MVKFDVIFDMELSSYIVSSDIDQIQSRQWFLMIKIVLLNTHQSWGWSTNCDVHFFLQKSIEIQNWWLWDL